MVVVPFDVCFCRAKQVNLSVAPGLKERVKVLSGRCFVKFDSIYVLCEYSEGVLRFVFHGVTEMKFHRVVVGVVVWGGPRW